MEISEDFKFWSTLILGFIGALVAWLPTIFETLKKPKIEGKIISQYYNIANNKQQLLFLYKLSIVATKKDFLLKDIDLKTKFKSSSEIISTSRNTRQIVFNIDEKLKKLNVPDNKFLNNLSVLKKDSPAVGYLFFSIDYDKCEPIDYIELNFISYGKKKEKKLRFSSYDIKEEKLLFDDSIWSDFDISTLAK
jgi:hypothetical protein